MKCWIIGALVIALSIGGQSQQVCEPGSSFMKECNTCRCSNDGKLVSCTRKFCLPDEQNDEPAANEESAVTPQAVANNQVCTPNEVKMEDCNRCKCANNGIGWFCTRKSCPPNREKRDTGYKGVPNLPGFSCSPGKSFKYECNSCRCGSDGRTAACTFKLCIAGEYRKKRQAPEKCVPGSIHLRKGAYSCTCLEDSTFDCKLIAQIESSNQAEKCIPGESFKRECNMCTCGPDGTPLACTQRACLPPSKNVKRQVQPEKCTPGTSFKDEDGCNDCFCNANGHAACTLKLCIPAPKVSTDCVPGTTFQKECNSCFCTETGNAVCTLRGCLR